MSYKVLFKCVFRLKLFGFLNKIFCVLVSLGFYYRLCFLSLDNVYRVDSIIDYINYYFDKFYYLLDSVFCERYCYLVFNLFVFICI